ncbi:BatD family protein [Odoribacter lunatus]|uniref:BatD family protein n=1 Tax=Odoribacter lunatus TaxID=2941335 RepID=UPI00203D134F|nr:BatD family protein [Odoribacter lunatus]
MRWSIFLWLFLAALTGKSQSVEFKAEAPEVVEIGEQFRLSYSLNQKGTNLQVPTLEGFDLLMGPRTSTSSSFSSINGQVSQSVSYTYTYVLEGVKEGTFQIPAARVTVDGKQYSSNTLTIQVVKGNGNAARGNGNRATRPEAGAKVSDENLFVKVDVSRKSLFMGESLVATIKVYTRVDLINFGQSKFPSFSGFLSEEVPTPQRVELSRENYDGKVYNVGVIRKLLLFPQHTGDITIEPFDLECIVRQQLTNSRSFFDDFFGNYKDVRVRRSSRPVTIHVKELPLEGRPADFSGTVGHVTMRTSISTDSLKANEAITYKVIFQGTGNLKLIEVPNVHFPADFESYEPKVTKDVNTGENGMAGTVTYEYLLIPRYAGDYTIPPVRFSYYDTRTNAYKTLRGNEYNIHVEKGAGGNSPEGNVASVQSFKREEVRQLGKDIRYIKTGDLDLYEKGSGFYGTMAYWLAFAVPFVLFVLGSLITRRRIKANADVARVKNKGANKMAKKRMKIAAVAMKNRNPEVFYEEVLKGLWGYVSDKLNVDKAELNRDNISEILQYKSVNNDMIQEFINVLDTCEFARYAPGGKSAQEMEKVYRDSIDIITRLDKVIK